METKQRLEQVQARTNKVRAEHARVAVHRDNALEKFKEASASLKEHGISSGTELNERIKELTASYEAALVDAEKKLEEAEGV